MLFCVFWSFGSGEPEVFRGGSWFCILSNSLMCVVVWSLLFGIRTLRVAVCNGFGCFVCSGDGTW